MTVKKHLPKTTEIRQLGFTLIELLVVIAVISLLIAIIVPIFSLAKEQARRVVCRNNIHLFLVAIHAYASGNDDALPSGLPGLPEPEENDEHTPVLSRETIDTLTDLTGNGQAMVCPWLRNQFEGPVGWRYYGHWFIGYNYLGGHQETPWSLYEPAEESWISPQKSTGRSDLLLVAELNTWTPYPGHEMSFAPHGKRGAIRDYMRPGTGGGKTAKEIGAVGGNNGLLDGSAHWKDIAEMKIYRSSRWYGPTGCFSYW